MNKVLITGASGDLGRVLSQRAVAAGYDVTSVYLSRPERVVAGQPLRLDLCDGEAVRTALERLEPDVIIHTAVVQNIPDPRQPIVSAARNLDRLRSRHTRLVVVSSDMVFDGTQAPYREDAPVSPVSLYGEAKAQAEQFGDCVVRTSLIYDFAPGNRQVDWLLERIGRGERCRLFVDEFRSPIWAANLADALLELATQPIGGILNVAGPECMSRLELGRALLEALGYDPKLHIEPTSQAGTGRPPDLTLDVGKARALLTTPLLTFAGARLQAGIDRKVR